MKIEFTVMGDPRPKARPRIGRYGAYTPTATKKAEEEFLKQAMPFRPVKPLTGSIIIILKFYKKGRVKDIGKPVIKRPDLDNYEKLAIDALGDWFWLDDSQISEAHAFKKYDRVARTEVIIIPITEEDKALIK